jgi:hypothetical protein
VERIFKSFFSGDELVLPDVLPVRVEYDYEKQGGYREPQVVEQN